MNERVTCGCGAMYEIVDYTHLTMRDKDSYDCDVCSANVISWDGSSIPSLRLVQRPEGR
jgi:hypothetical protein